jgi:hypothetical protein
MPLTPEERCFLDAYVYEVTHGPPFGGPATEALGRKNVRYSDLNWILTAYQRELTAAGKPSAGKHNPNPPSSPWSDLEEVKRRCKFFKSELEDLDSICKGPMSVEEIALYEKAKELFDPAETERILGDQRGQGVSLAEFWKQMESTNRQ